MSHKRKSYPPSSSSSLNADDGDVDDLRPRRAFRVRGPPDFSQAEPQSAEEYLRRVRWEAQHQPKVLTAPVNPAQWKEGEGRGQGLRRLWGKGLDPLPPTSPLAMPSREWEESFTAEFTSVRLAFTRYLHLQSGDEQKDRGRGSGPGRSVDPSPPPRSPHRPLPPMRDYPAWLRFCLGKDADVERCIRGEGGVGEEGVHVTGSTTPDLRTVAGWDQVTTRGVLHHLIDHLHRCHQRITEHLTSAGAPAHPLSTETVRSDEEEMAESAEEDKEGEVEDEEGEVEVSCSPVLASNGCVVLSVLCLPRVSHMVWLYAALVHLEKPLPADVGVQLRQLYRVCGKIRAEAGWRLEELREQRTGERKMEGRRAEESDARDEQQQRVLECAMHCNLLMTVVDKVFGQRMDMEAWIGG